VKLLTAYRVMAYVTGVLLIVLVFVAVPLQIWGNSTTLVAIVGFAHGWLFVIYCLITLALYSKSRWPLWRLPLILAAGTIPFAVFFAEHWVTKWAHEHEAPKRARAATR
jgi:integral membrane protein